MLNLEFYSLQVASNIVKIIFFIGAIIVFAAVVVVALLLELLSFWANNNFSF